MSNKNKKCKEFEQDLLKEISNIKCILDFIFNGKRFDSDIFKILIRNCYGLYGEERVDSLAMRYPLAVDFIKNIDKDIKNSITNLNWKIIKSLMYKLNNELLKDVFYKYINVNGNDAKYTINNLISLSDLILYLGKSVSFDENMLFKLNLIKMLNSIMGSIEFLLLSTTFPVMLSQEFIYYSKLKELESIRPKNYK